RLEAGRVLDERRDFVPTDYQQRRLHRPLVLADLLGVAVLDLLALLEDRRLDFVELRHEHRVAHGVQVVEDRGRPRGLWIFRLKAGATWRYGFARPANRGLQVAPGFSRDVHQLGQRHDRGLIDRLDRSLRIRIVGAQGLDIVADELDADRKLGPGGLEV